MTETNHAEPQVDMRTQLLDAATRLFAAQGFDGTSIQAIADAVGIRKPSLLYHFASKDDLRRAVLDRVLSHWNDVLPEILRVAMSGERRFDAVFAEVVRWFEAEPERARLLVRAALDHPDETRALLSRHLAHWHTVVAERIRMGQREGVVPRDVDPEAYVMQAFNIVVGGVALAEVSGGLLEATPGGAALPRQTTELRRIARTALFGIKLDEPPGSRR
jgi:AcrR family transcriptional regulator